MKAVIPAASIMPKKVVAVIQARMESVRLPGKMLVPLGGRPVIEHVITAVKAGTLVDDVVLATTLLESDDELERVGRSMGVRVYRGSVDDVLGRFVGALDGDSADVVIRQTADNPLTDPNVIDCVVGTFFNSSCDYVSNNIERTWPRGHDTEVFSREALNRCHQEADLDEYREHVTLYMRTHQSNFSQRNVYALPQETWPELRLTIDTVEDKALLERVFDALYVPGKILRVGAVIDWLRDHPEVVKLNQMVQQKATLGKVF